MASPIEKLPASPWAGSYHHRDDARVRIYAFYGAGGTAAMFEIWQKLLAKQFPEIEFCGVEWPGRGKHKGDFISDPKLWLAAIREQILKPAMKEWFKCPFVFLGQSTGARLAYDLVRELSKDKILPGKVYVVARSPPVVPDLKWVDEAPEDSLEYLNWISEELLESQAEKLKTLWPRLPKEDLEQRVALFRADLELNAAPLEPLAPTEWKVVAPGGKLVKKNVPMSDRMIQIVRDQGSTLHTTGQEFTGPTGGKWVQLDPEYGEKNKGWLLVHGKTVGVDHQLLDVVAESVPEGDSEFWQAPVPFQIHVSDKDRIQPWKDPTGRLRPTEEWVKLTKEVPEYVKYEGMLHDAFLMDPSVITNICNDIIKLFNLR